MFFLFLKQPHNISQCNIYINLRMFNKQNFNIFEKSKIEPIFRNRKFHLPLFIKLVEVTLETWEFFQNQS